MGNSKAFNLVSFSEINMIIWITVQKQKKKHLDDVT